MVNKLSVEQVKGEVLRFWNAFTDKSASQLMEFYAPESTVFSSVSNRSEPGRLAAARRQREYFHTKSSLRATVGNIDVILLGDGAAAIASYTFQFHASKVASIAGLPSEEDIRNGRASHIFAFDADGKVRIMHEHLSTIEKA